MLKKILPLLFVLITTTTYAQEASETFKQQLRDMQAKISEMETELQNLKKDVDEIEDATSTRAESAAKRAERAQDKVDIAWTIFLTAACAFFAAILLATAGTFVYCLVKAREAAEYADRVKKSAANFHEIAHQESRISVLLSEAGALIGINEFAEALAKAEEVIALDKVSGRGYRMKGRVFYFEGKDERHERKPYKELLNAALANFKRALRIYAEGRNKSGIARLYVDMALCYQELEDYKEALSHIDQALEITDYFENARARYQRVAILVSRNKEEDYKSIVGELRSVLIEVPMYRAYFLRDCEPGEVFEAYREREEFNKLRELAKGQA